MLRPECPHWNDVRDLPDGEIGIHGPDLLDDHAGLRVVPGRLVEAGERDARGEGVGVGRPNALLAVCSGTAAFGEERGDQPQPVAYDEPCVRILPLALTGSIGRNQSDKQKDETRSTPVLRAHR